MSDTTTTKAVTPTIMPSSVNAERSLCAQIAATASFRVSMNFTALDHYAISHKEAQKIIATKRHKTSTEECRSVVQVKYFVTFVPFCGSFSWLLPAEGVDRVQARCFPGRPESKHYADSGGDPNPDTDGP